LGQRAALYCRVSTADQSCGCQEHELAAFAARAGAERKKVMALAQRREIDAVLVTKLSRWSAARSTSCTC
jgi:putative DNA-invertase from lambdoid prophage Rac